MIAERAHNRPLANKQIVGGLVILSIAICHNNASKFAAELITQHLGTCGIAFEARLAVG
jgi:hypothetical protein